MIKRLNTVVLFLAAISTSACAQWIHCAHAEPYPETQYPVASTFARQEIRLPSKILAFDDYVEAISKAGNVNIIADVTSIPPDEKVRPFPDTPMAKMSQWKPKLYLALFDFSQQSQLSQFWYDPSTFIFWKEPDAVDLARQLMARFDTDPSEKLAKPIDLYEAIAQNEEFFKQVPKEGRIIYTPLNNLSPQRRERVKAIVKQLFIATKIPDFAYFSNFYWDTALIRLRSCHLNNKDLTCLQVAGQYHQDQEHTIDGGLIGLSAPK